MTAIPSEPSYIPLTLLPQKPAHLDERSVPHGFEEFAAAMSLKGYRAYAAPDLAYPHAVGLLQRRLTEKGDSGPSVSSNVVLYERVRAGGAPACEIDAYFGHDLPGVFGDGRAASLHIHSFALEDLLARIDGIEERLVRAANALFSD